MPRTTIEIESVDVPQAPNLARIRCVVAAVADGSTNLDQIAEDTDISARHVGYSVRAARSLGLLDQGNTPTELGRALLETEQESQEERDVLRRSIEGSAIVKALAPKLLSPKPPTKKTLGERIERLSGLSKATALHRASDLLAWREQLLEEDDAPASAETAEAPAPEAAAPEAAASEEKPAGEDPEAQG